VLELDRFAAPREIDERLLLWVRARDLGGAAPLVRTPFWQALPEPLIARWLDAKGADILLLGTTERDSWLSDTMTFWRRIADSPRTQDEKAEIFALAIDIAEAHWALVYGNAVMDLARHDAQLDEFRRLCTRRDLPDVGDNGKPT
jgi:hypothetical protein